MISADESRSETLAVKLQEHGELITFWRHSKGLPGASRAGARTPVARTPLRIFALFEERRGGKQGGTAVVTLDSRDAGDNSLTSPGEEWDIQRTGEDERMPVTGRFKSVGSPDSVWISGIVNTGGGKDV